MLRETEIKLKTWIHKKNYQKAKLLRLFNSLDWAFLSFNCDWMKAVKRPLVVKTLPELLTDGGMISGETQIK